MSNFSQGQDWDTAGWGSRAPPRGAAKQQALNSARRVGNVVTETKCTFLAKYYSTRIPYIPTIVIKNLTLIGFY